MPYREKTAWLALVAIAITFGPFFVFFGLQGKAATDGPLLPKLILFASVVAAQVVIMVAGHIVLAAQSPTDARTPPDERDRAIMSRSVTYAYYVLISGTILVGCVMPFNSHGWAIVQATLAMIVAAELVKYGTIAASYRRQA